MNSSSRKVHVSIIMDGNGRWAEARGLRRLQGHLAGARAVERTVEAAVRAGVGTLSLYAFSTENWRRPREEIAGLMALLGEFLRTRREKLLRNGVRLRWLGRHDRVPEALRRQFDEVEAATADSDRMTLVLAVDYGGRWELAQAALKLAARLEGAATSLIGPRPADPSGPTTQDNRGADGPLDAERDFAASLPSGWLPEVDLLIRTSGEQRLSNFLPWQAAYAELYFTPVLWPDFGERELRSALAWYAGRARRYGGLGALARRMQNVEGNDNGALAPGNVPSPQSPLPRTTRTSRSWHSEPAGVDYG
jgi:undecaprenyl diphosphate synthase